MIDRFLWVRSFPLWLAHSPESRQMAVRLPERLLVSLAGVTVCSFGAAKVSTFARRSLPSIVIRIFGWLILPQNKTGTK